jgi:hypothetical protein
MELKIEKYDSLEKWLPTNPTHPIDSGYLESLGFGHNERGELNDATKEFIESCTEDLETICPSRGYGFKVYALSFAEGPESYPDVQEDCRGQHHQVYYDLLSEAQRECMEGVFDFESPLDHEYKKRFDGFMDHFGTYGCVRAPAKKASLNLNWHQFNQSDTVYLYTDWEQGFWDLSAETLDNSVWGELGTEKFDYRTQWEAFMGQYTDLLGLAMMQWWVQKNCGPEEMMYRWRGNLGRHLGDDIEDITHELAELDFLNKVMVTYGCNSGLKPDHFLTKVMGWTDVVEFAAESDENCELVPELNRACKALRHFIVELVAEAVRREQDCVVITTTGDPVTYKDNGRTQETIDLKKFLKERLAELPTLTFDANLPIKKDPVLRHLATIWNDCARMGDVRESAEHFISMVKDRTSYDRKETL